MRRRLTAGVLAGAVCLAGCDLDRANPNAPTSVQTLTTADGVIAVAVGLQNRWGAATGNFIYTAGLVTDELAAISAALVTISDAEGGVVPNGANLVGDVWSSAYRAVKTSNDLIVNAPSVEMNPATRGGILALAYLVKAAAFGELIQAFQQIPLETYTTATPTFVDRATALARILALLDSAQTAYDAQAPSAQFTSQVLVRGLDVRNTIFAYRARFQRIAGNDQAALMAANAVDRRVFSVLPYSDQVRNPVNNTSSGSSGVLPRDAWRLAALPNDQRPAYFVTAAAVTGRIGTPLDNWARFATPSAPLAAYYPDEVLLIKAEALANQNQLAAAQAALDSVRTDCGGLVTTDPPACLPPLGGPQSRDQLLAEIYYNRRFELFATGLRWEDTRRQNQVGAGAPGKRCWLPYPISERNANPDNVPPDPEGANPPAFPARCF